MTPQQISQMQAARFRKLAWPMLPVVLRTAQCLVGHHGHTEDLAQETMIKAMRAIDSFKDGTNLKAWLLTILRRTHIDQIRSTRNRPLQLSLDVNGIDLPASAASVTEEPITSWDDPEQLMSRFDDQVIIGAMGLLSEEIRWTLLLVDVEQMEQAQAAQILGVAVGTIKSRTHRGRALLRELLHDVAAKRGWLGAKEKTS